MSSRASELYEMARSLPAEQRRDLARRLLTSAERELEDREAGESPQPKGICAYDELHDDPSRGTSPDQVKAYFDAKWSGERFGAG